MQQNYSREPKGKQQHPPSVHWRHVRWISVCLLLLVAACAPAPAVSTMTPTVSSPIQRASITTYHGHTSTVFAVAWSPDGTRIVSGGNDNTIQVWDTSSGKPLLSYTGHLGSIWSVAWSPDGRRIASGGNDDTVQVWDAMTGHRLFTYSGHTAPVWAVAWSPSGKCMVSATGNISGERPKETLQAWNAMIGHLLSSYPVASSTTYTDGTLSVAWSPDSAHIASDGADTIVLLRSVPNCRI